MILKRNEGVVSDAIDYTTPSCKRKGRKQAPPKLEESKIRISEASCSTSAEKIGHSGSELLGQIAVQRNYDVIEFCMARGTRMSTRNCGEV